MPRAGVGVNVQSNISFLVGGQNIKLHMAPDCEGPAPLREGLANVTHPGGIPHSKVIRCSFLAGSSAVGPGGLVS